MELHQAEENGQLRFQQSESFLLEFRFKISHSKIRIFYLLIQKSVVNSAFNCTINVLLGSPYAAAHQTCQRQGVHNTETQTHGKNTHMHTSHMHTLLRQHAPGTDHRFNMLHLQTSRIEGEELWSSQLEKVKPWQPCSHNRFINTAAKVTTVMFPANRTIRVGFITEGTTSITSCPRLL